MRSKHILATLLLAITILGACTEDEPTITYSTATYEASININPNNFPSGAGLNLTLGDTGKVAQLDDDPTFEWDIKMMTFRTGQGGRPGLFLFNTSSSNQTVTAVNVSENYDIALGSTGFSSFTQVTSAMRNSLSADGNFNFDPQTDVDGSGKPDAEKLATAYESLVIGNKIVNLDESEQPVFLIKSRTGAYFKFQMVNRENGGNTNLRWARFDADMID